MFDSKQMAVDGKFTLSAITAMLGTTLLFATRWQAVAFAGIFSQVSIGGHGHLLAPTTNAANLRRLSITSSCVMPKATISHPASEPP